MRAAALALVLVVVALGTVARAPAALAEPGPARSAVDDEEPTTTPTTAPVGGTTGDIIPRPGSGTPPQASGDRGGAGQVGVFVAICIALAVIAALAVRDGRRARARSGASRPPDPPDDDAT